MEDWKIRIVACVRLSGRIRRGDEDGKTRQYVLAKGND